MLKDHPPPLQSLILVMLDNDAREMTTDQICPTKLIVPLTPGSCSSAFLILFGMVGEEWHKTSGLLPHDHIWALSSPYLQPLHAYNTSIIACRGIKFRKGLLITIFAHGDSCKLTDYDQTAVR